MRPAAATSEERVRMLRMRSQRLAPETAAASVLEACRAVAGLQAQSWSATPLGVRARTRVVTAADVEHARLVDRSVIRTWSLRGTLHLTATEDLGWLLGLVAPYAIARDSRRRLELGIDEAVYDRAVGVLERVLAGGPATRADIEGALVRAGVPIEPRTQASIHVLQRAAFEGRVCYGPGRGRQESFALLRDWADIGPAIEPDIALTELARRFLTGFGPAAVEDFAKWSALPVPLCRRAFTPLSNELTEIEAWGRRLWALRSPADAGEPVAALPVRLLGAFDTYLIGYRDRRQLVDDAGAYGRIWVGGLISPVAVAAGRIVGTWKAESRVREMVVRVSPFAPLDAATAGALRAESADLGRFLGVFTRLEVTPVRGA